MNWDVEDVNNCDTVQGIFPDLDIVCPFCFASFSSRKVLPTIHAIFDEKNNRSMKEERRFKELTTYQIKGHQFER